MLFVLKPAFSQKTVTNIKVPYVDVVDNTFSTLIISIVREAKTCSITRELPCGILSRKRLGESGNYHYSFSIAPFDDLELLIESQWHINQWRTVTIDNIPIIFLYEDSDKFKIIDTVDVTINTHNRVTYQYIWTNNDTIDISNQRAYPICLYETYILENGEYRLLHKDRCIDISNGERRNVSKHEVLYIIRE